MNERLSLVRQLRGLARDIGRPELEKAALRYQRDPRERSQLMARILRAELERREDLRLYLVDETAEQERGRWSVFGCRSEWDEEARYAL